MLERADVGRAGAQSELAVLERHSDVADERISVRSRVLIERQRRVGIGNPTHLGAPARRIGRRANSAIQLEQLAAPIARRIPEIGVEHTIHQRVSHFGVIEVRKDVHSQPLVGNETNYRDHAVDAAGVEVDHAAAVVLLEPTKGVRRPMRVR